MNRIQTTAILTLLAVAGGLAGCGGADIEVAAVPAVTAARPTSDDAKAPASSVAPTAAGSRFAAAAVANAELAREIEWFFGGRTQRGWAIYGDLIGHLVGTDADPSSTEFARAVAAWQKRRGIRPANGIVTVEVWQQMMRDLQWARRFDAATPPAGELLETPATEWYDRGRAPELRKLRRDAYDAYTRMVAAARADLGDDANGYFSIISGYRSAEYQASLRQKAGNPSTAQLAVRSPHFTGRAIDLYVGGDPVSTADTNRALQVQTPAYRWLARNAHRFGFRPYFYEPWHWEYDPQLAAAAAEMPAPATGADDAVARRLVTRFRELVEGQARSR